MPGWYELATYQPLIVLLGGVAMAFAFNGVGKLAFLATGTAPHGPLRLPAEFVLGVLAVSLLVQVLAMLGVATGTVLAVIAWLLLVPATFALASCIRALKSSSVDGELRRTFWFWVPGIVMVVTLFAASLAPQSRSDEIGYHVLVGSRVIADGALRFYPLPWEATVTAQFVWHYALVPLTAICGAAPGGVVSACAALLIAGSVAELVRTRTDTVTAAVAFFCVLASGYVVALFSTMGPHAFGYLATFVGCAAVIWKEELRQHMSLPAYVLVVAIGCAGMIAGKVTMLPLALLLSALAAKDVFAEEAAASRRLAMLATLAALPAIALVPLLAWSWIETGSPLGSLTATALHSTRYDAEALSAYDGTRELFKSMFLWRFELAYWNVGLLLCVCAAVLLEPASTRRTRLWLIAGCQLLVLVLFLPKEIRHLGGVQYVLFASGVPALAAWLGRWGFKPRTFAIGLASAAAPWALLAIWISSIYVPLLLAQQTPRQFMERYSGLFEDYERLDRILPADARVLIGRSASSVTQYAWYARPSVYYSPRPVLFHTAEVAATGRSPVYLFYVGAGSTGMESDPERGPIPIDPRLPPGYTLGRSVYSNPAARFFPSRTPAAGQGALTRVDVFELLPTDSPR